jgi:hypothetical protein
MFKTGDFVRVTETGNCYHVANVVDFRIWLEGVKDYFVKEELEFVKA